MIKKYKKINIITILLTISATAAHISLEQRYPLIAAASAGNLQKTQVLLAQGHNPNEQTKHLCTPLNCCLDYKSAHKDYVEIAKILLRAKADPNLEGILGYTPLMTAIIKDSITHPSESIHDLIELFLNAGANWEQPNHYGQTAYSFSKLKPLCEKRILDYKEKKQKEWLHVTSEILSHKLSEIFLREDILSFALPQTAKEIQKVSPRRFD